jgi:hypothetical protein
MKHPIPLFLALTLGVPSALYLAACSLFTPQNAKTALEVTQVACVFATQLTDAKAVADVCKIDRTLVPVIEQLIAQREGAKKVGVVWGADAGPDGIK